MSGARNNSARSHQMQSLRMPLLQAFRDHAASGDGRRGARAEGASGTTPPETRLRPTTSTEAMLRDSLDQDLANLLNTVNLGSVMDLSSHPRVARSTLNFGMDDLVHMTTDYAHLDRLGAKLQAVLLAHEPRLDKRSLKVVSQDDIDELNQRVAFTVQADMLCHPVDIPLEFVAEMDVGSGKVDLRNLARNRPGRRDRDADAPGRTRPEETGSG